MHEIAKLLTAAVVGGLCLSTPAQGQSLHGTRANLFYYSPQTNELSFDNLSDPLCVALLDHCITGPGLQRFSLQSLDAQAFSDTTSAKLLLTTGSMNQDELVGAGFASVVMSTRFRANADATGKVNFLAHHFVEAQGPSLQWFEEVGSNWYGDASGTLKFSLTSSSEFASLELYQRVFRGLENVSGSIQDRSFAFTQRTSWDSRNGVQTASARLPFGTAAETRGNFAFDFDFVEGEMYDLRISAECRVESLANPNARFFGGVGPRRSVCNLFDSAYWNGVTDIVMAGGRSASEFALVGDGHNFAFSSPLSPAPVAPAPNPIPEPATWAMMIAGFGLAGAKVRRRRSVLA